MQKRSGWPLVARLSAALAVGIVVASCGGSGGESSVVLSSEPAGVVQILVRACAVADAVGSETLDPAGVVDIDVDSEADVARAIEVVDDHPNRGEVCPQARSLIVSGGES